MTLHALDDKRALAAREVVMDDSTLLRDVAHKVRCAKSTLGGLIKFAHGYGHAELVEEMKIAFADLVEADEIADKRFAVLDAMAAKRAASVLMAAE